jgi:hypothetical protein
MKYSEYFFHSCCNRQNKIDNDGKIGLMLDYDNIYFKEQVKGRRIVVSLPLSLSSNRHNRQVEDRTEGIPIDDDIDDNRINSRHDTTRRHDNTTRQHDNTNTSMKRLTGAPASTSVSDMIDLFLFYFVEER